jgi:hypothetical protein
MSALALELPLVWETAAAPDTEPAAADRSGESTLDDLLSGMWEGLAAHRSVACPLCGGEIRPDYGAHALPIGGSCQSCETRIS